MSKKNKTTLILVIVIIIAIIITVMMKNKKPEVIPQSASDMQIEQAVSSDTTVSINTALDNIKVDGNNDEDLKGIDAELNNL